MPGVEQLVARFSTSTDAFMIEGMELLVSFNEEGQFVGFGRGGVASIRLAIARREIDEDEPEGGT